ncbi:MAG: RNA polymerase subunit sigma-70 [Bacteroidetes bacterium HGW-Bacteroidetes-13]|jgi:RNA polymerase sigma-70 factor (ECF subfamily)|nr:MAG: RNA polymerase subunit sigma-70 [Bacteroidetes bacterium HGW-Bacteroidetes-13]
MQSTEFSNLIRPFQDKVFRLAKRLLVSTEEAQDATQDVLLKLWNKNKELDRFDNLEAFAMTVTKNHCLDRLKSKQAGVLTLVHSNYTDGNATVEEKMEQQDSVSMVEKLMTRLPEQQRMIVQLRDVEGYEFEEIASMLDMNETAIRVSLSRARKVLRDQLIKNHSYGIN